LVGLCTLSISEWTLGLLASPTASIACQYPPPQVPGLSNKELSFSLQGGLPLASFRFRVATDTLALSYSYCYLHRSGLSPYRQRPCRAHK
jgi:hypothetical protein